MQQEEVKGPIQFVQASLLLEFCIITTQKQRRIFISHFFVNYYQLLFSVSSHVRDQCRLSTGRVSTKLSMRVGTHAITVISAVYNLITSHVMFRNLTANHCAVWFQKCFLLTILFVPHIHPNSTKLIKSKTTRLYTQLFCTF